MSEPFDIDTARRMTSLDSGNGTCIALREHLHDALAEIDRLRRQLAEAQAACAAMSTDLKWYGHAYAGGGPVAGYDRVAKAAEQHWYLVTMDLLASNPGGSLLTELDRLRIELVGKTDRADRYAHLLTRACALLAHVLPDTVTVPGKPDQEEVPCTCEYCESREIRRRSGEGEEGMTQSKEECGFVFIEFIDGQGKPFHMRPWGTGDDWWLFYWHPDKHWVSLRRVTQVERDTAQLSALSESCAAVYHELNRKFNR